MLSEVLKKYETYKKNSQKYLQQTKQKLEEQLQAKTIQALKIQNHKVIKIHSNQQDIENRLRRNGELQTQLKTHLGGWVLLYEQLNKALKEAGDVVNYAQYVEEEIKQISHQLQNRMKQQISNKTITIQKALQNLNNQNTSQNVFQQQTQAINSNIKSTDRDQQSKIKQHLKLQQISSEPATPEKQQNIIKDQQQGQQQNQSKGQSLQQKTQNKQSLT